MAVKKINGYPEGTLPEELLKLLQSIASNRGNSMDIANLKVVQLSGAMTNEIYRISWTTDSDDDRPNTVLVRMYGEGVDHFFDRDDEIRTFECLSANGHGPKLLGRFREGRVEEFIHARTLSAADLRDRETSALIASKMREFHNLDMPSPKNVVLWQRLRKWVNVARDLCSQEHVKEYRLDSLDEEISLLEKFVSRDGQEIGFCHNDLQYGNIMIDDRNKTITIIDYEYASYNPVAYDIANHFCEMAADYHTDTPHVLDYDKYPGSNFEHSIFRVINYAGQTNSVTSLDELEDDINKYTLPNHIFWGLWALISAYVNHIEFDYLEYARQRFEQYWSKKKEILNLQQCPGTRVVC
ncbi:Probable choline kinase 1 [Striga hermonthica]|uniref:Probable choline kinase 1 n=1 Tax=Striga hermonthica TaxID=68872 RepID=A0A9N7MR72_STRHE|nr:Probable choline kinase 1 [Striga hermonthica]